MASIATYNFPKAYHGDTYKQISFAVTVNGLPQDIAGAEIRMWIVLRSAIPALKLSTVDNTIVITDAANGAFHIPSFIVAFPPAVYTYDIEIKFAGGRVKTYMKGTFEVENDVTKLD